MPQLTVNGEACEFAANDFPATIAALIDQRGLNRKAVVAEVDGAIVSQDAFASHAIQDGAIIELVQFVGGG